jgi:hypothetical protein
MKPEASPTIEGVESSPRFSQVSLNERVSSLKSELRPVVNEITSGASEYMDAQLTIWGMKAGRFAVMGVFGLVGLAAMSALAVYGFILLNALVDWALQQTGIPWLSPLVRGALYFGVPMAILFMVWHTSVGYGSSDKKASVNGAGAEKMEAGRGI